jgi:hypothetical protein
MSYINDALRKAQKDRDGRYERFGGIISPCADGPMQPSKRRLVLGAAVTLAKDLSAEFVVGLIGADVVAAAQTVGACGASAFYAVSGADFGPSRYASDAAAAEAVCKAAGPSLVIAAATSRASRALPGVAQRLDGRIDTQATAIAVDGGAPALTRWYYRQRMFAQLTREQRPWIVTLAGGCSPAWQGAPQTPPMTALDVNLPDAAKRTTVVGLEAPESSIAAIDWITSVGAIPTVCVFRPLKGTDYDGVAPPRTEEMIPVFRRLYEACMKNNLPIGVAPNIHVSLVLLPEECRWFVDNPAKYALKEMKLKAMSGVFSAGFYRQMRKVQGAHRSAAPRTA